jgi:hypothetical protein
MKKLSVILVTLLLVFSISAIASADVHSVNSLSPIQLTDGLTNIPYTNVSGFCSMNWKEVTRYGFFNAQITVWNVPQIHYELQLVSIGNCTVSQIEGLWDIKRDGVLVASGIVGILYGINQPAGPNYFKFYGGDSQHNTNRWYLSAYITQRFDY